MNPSTRATNHQLLVVRVIYFFFFSAFGIFTAYLNVYFHTIDLSGVEIGALNSQIMVIGMVSAPVWSYLNDRLAQPKLIFFLVVSGALLGTIAMGAVKNYQILLIAAAFFGLFFNPIMPLIDRTNLGLLGDRRELYARQRIWGSIGFIFSTVLVGRVVQLIGLNQIFTIMAVSFGFVILAIGFLPVLPKIKEQNKKISFWLLFKQPAWILFSIGIFVVSISNAGMNNFLGILMQDLGGSEQLIGMAFSLGAISELPIMFFSPWLLKKMGIKNMILVAVFAFVLRMALYAVMPQASWALPISLLNSLTFGIFWIASVVYVNQLAPAGLESTSQSLLLSTMSLASVVGAPISGWLYDLRGGTFLFGGFAVLAFSSLIWFWLGFRTR